MTQVATFEVPVSTEGRADKVLAIAFPDTSRSLIKKSIEEGRVHREDGSFIEPKTKLRAGEVLVVDLARPKVAKLKPFECKLDILHEDDQMVVINKPAGMVVHPGDGTDDNTLVHALLHHCPKELCPVGAPDRPGIVHRLDKETSGVMVVAKKESAYHNLVDQFSNRLVSKRYSALVTGKMKSTSGSFTEPIGRHPKVRVKMAVVPNGKNAHTDWVLSESYTENFSLVDCDLKTGRTHQIRVHLSHAGHPLIGDVTYGYNPNKTSLIKEVRVMLHARELSFNHPSTSQPVSFSASIPEDMNLLIEKLRKG